MALLREYTVLVSEYDELSMSDETKEYKVVAETMKVLDDEYIFQTYVEQSSSFRTDAAFDRVNGRKFSITSTPL